MRPEHEDVGPALDSFSTRALALDLRARLRPSAGASRRLLLLPASVGGSACKRLNLFLRWMIRHDEIDLGVWTAVPAVASWSCRSTRTSSGSGSACG